jgi:hypothetical protein
MLYPRDYSQIGEQRNTTHMGVCYNNLRIRAMSYSARDQERSITGPTTVFHNVTARQFGAHVETKCQFPS